jgi:Na+-driven multidrug efflux pump
MVVIVIVIALDFQQGCQMGPLKALGQQTNAMYVNIVTYYVFVIPLAYFFAFKCKVLSNGEKPLGLIGLWFGFVIGLLHQIIMYSVLTKHTDWE